MKLSFKILLASLTILLSWADTLHSQDLDIDANASEDGLDFLYNRIQQIDGFMNQFNQGNIAHLFDEQYAYKDKEQFIQNAKKHQLDFYDTKWLAQVNCEVFYQEQIQNIELFLKVRTNSDNGRSKWEIIGVNTSFLDITAECPDSTTFLPPSANGTQFMALKRVLNDKANLSAYTSLDAISSQLPIFIFLLKNDLLQFKQIQNIHYYFAQVPQYVFRLSDFNRPNHNSGWLIDQVLPQTEIPLYLLHYLKLKNDLFK